MKALKILPYCFDGVTAKTFNPGDPVVVGKDVRSDHVPGLEQAGYLGPDDAEVSSLSTAPAPVIIPHQTQLREDGPTVAQYVAAGYQASNYPPQGYASKSTADEIAAAIEAQRLEAEKLKNAGGGNGDDQPKVDDHKFAKVEIIEAWAHLEWPAYKALAAQVSDAAITTKVEATAAIEAELKRRAEFAEANKPKA